MWTIAGGIVLVFLIIRFLLNWEHDGRVHRQLEERAHARADWNERERLRLLAIRLCETNPALYEEASARVPEPQSSYPEDANKQINVVDEAGKIHTVWPSELPGKPHLRRIGLPKQLSDIAREAEAICKQRGLPPP